MRLAEIHIDGFGLYHNFTFKDLPPGLAIILGDNESGKSSLLAFLRAILFGFPDARTNQNLYPPLRGGRKGGRIVLVRSDNERYVVERYDGKKGGRLRVVFPDGSERGEDAFRQMTGAISRDVFQNVFAFSLGELQEFDSLDKDEIRQTIYSAGLGTGARRISEVQKQLAVQREKLFLPRGQRKINHLLSQLDQLNRAIRECQQEPEKYTRLHGELAGKRTDLEQLESRLRQKRQRLERVKLLLAGWKDWTSLRQDRKELEDIPEMESFPIDGVARLDLLVERRRQVCDQIEEGKRKRGAEENQLTSIHIETSFLKEADKIREIERSRETFEKESRQLPGIEAEHSRAENQFQEALYSLGPEWTKDRIRRFDTSVPVREEVRRFRDSLSVAGDEARTCKARIDEAERVLKHAREVEEDARHRLETLPRPLENFDEQGIQQLQLGYEHFQVASGDLGTRKEELQHEQESLKDALRDVGPDWNEEKLEKFDTSIAVKEEVREHQAAVNRAVRRLEDAEKGLAAEDNNLRRAEKIRDEAQKELDCTDEPTIKENALLEKRRAALCLIRSQLTQRDKQQTRLEHIEERQLDLEEQSQGLTEQANRLGSILPLWPAAAVLAIGLFATIGIGLGAFVSSGVLAVGYSLIRSWLKRRQQQSMALIEEQTRNLKERLSKLETSGEDCLKALEEIEEQIQNHALKAQLSGDLELPVIDKAGEELERMRDGLARWKAGQEKLREAEEAQQQAEKALEQAKGEINQARRQKQIAQEEWSQWLRQAGLRSSLGPEIAGDVLAGLSAARERLKSVKTLRERIRAIEKTIGEYRENVRSVLERLGREQVPQEKISETINLLVAELKEQERRKQKWEEVLRQLKEAGKNCERESKNVEAAHQRLNRAFQEEEQKRQAWQESLHRLGFRESLSPVGALELFERLEGSRTKLDGIEKLRDQERATNRFVNEYHQKVILACRTLGQAEPGQDKVGIAVDSLVEKLSAAIDAQGESKMLQQNIGKLKEEIQARGETLSRREKEISDLLSAGGASCQEEFRRRAALYEKHQELERMIHEHEGRLQNLVGLGHTLETFKKELASVTPEVLNEEKQSIEEIIESEQQISKEENQKVGGLEKELGQLEASGELSRHRLEKEAHLADLRAAAREWSVLKLTEHLITKAREKYERERRPDVLKDAERYFSHFTGGRYVEVNAPLGETQVQVVTSDQQRLEIGELSRGTAEQLYLSLRFGFVQEYARSSEPLPLVFDDILVNFDPERARTAVESILEFSRSHQILLFTCHPATVDLVHSVDDSTPVWRISEGKITNKAVA
ncbi:AAA family ATPase [bacterium]|nr:AAA family ATPase [bacterium]